MLEAPYRSEKDLCILENNQNTAPIGTTGPRLPAPPGRRDLFLNLLKYRGLAGNSQRVRHRTRAPTQADAGLISKCEQCYAEVFEIQSISARVRPPRLRHEACGGHMVQVLAKQALGGRLIPDHITHKKGGPESAKDLA